MPPTDIAIRSQIMQKRVPVGGMPTPSAFSFRCLVRTLAALFILASFTTVVAAQSAQPHTAAVTSGAASTASTADRDTHEFTLANGLRLIVKEDHRAPTVAHQVWYKTGSVDEVSGTTGVAHMLEHMMFRGTPAYPAGEFSRTVAALGGRENAMTSRDFTMYYQQAEKSHLPKLMAMEADRMVNLKMSREDFQREMKVVMEERRLRTDDSASGTVYEQLMATMYSASPYRHPIVGWMDDLRNMKPDDALQWYRRWYTPNNVIVVIVGDVDPKAVRAMAERTYGKVKPRALPARTLRDEPEQKGIKRIEVKAPAENPSVTLAFKTPRLTDVEKDTDVYALEVLAAVLSGYDNARLDRLLVRERRLADNAGAGYDGVGRGPSMFTLEATPAAGHTTAELEQALRAEIARIAADGVSDDELRRIKTQVISRQVYKRDSVFGQGMEIGASELSGISWRQLDRILERIRAVTSDEVKAVAGRYFTDDVLTVATLLPQPIDPRKPPRAAPAELRH